MTIIKLLINKQMSRTLFNANICSFAVVFFMSLGMCQMMAQEEIQRNQNTVIPNTDFYDYRGTNTIDIGIGTSVMNGDFVDPIFEIYTHFGYKRYIIPYVNVNIGYHKFNLAYKDLFNEGFMSFDLNLEVLPFPHERVSPFFYAGGGINAANYFTQVDSKWQGGFGVEYIAYEGVGLKLYADYNMVASDELDGKIYGESDDTYWRLAFGINFYFGGQKKKEKILKNIPTVIKSNPITTH